MTRAEHDDHARKLCGCNSCCPPCSPRLYADGSFGGCVDCGLTVGEDDRKCSQPSRRFPCSRAAAILVALQQAREQGARKALCDALDRLGCDPYNFWNDPAVSVEDIHRAIFEHTHEQEAIAREQGAREARLKKSTER